MIEGKNIYLRMLEEEDLGLVMMWRNQPHIRKYFFDKSLLSMSGQKMWHERYVADSARQIFIAVEKESKDPAGMIGLYDIDKHNHKAELGSTMVGNKNMQGKGLATEMVELLLDYAFADLNMNRIYAYVLDYNQASIRVKEKCGFIREGTLKEDHYANGKFCNVHLYGITRSRWLSLKS